MKYIICIIGLIVTMGCKTSKIESKIFFPKKGDIEFSKISSVLNEEEFNTSTEKTNAILVSEMKQQIIDERKQLNQPIDSIELDRMLSLKTSSIGKKIFSFIYNGKKENIRHSYQDSLIIITEKINAKIIGDYRVVNRDKKTWFYLAKSDSVSKYFLNKKYEYSNDNNLKIKEFKNETKIINGFVCFKIEVEHSNILEDIIPNTTSSVFTSTQKMFVTDKIKSKFHPVINNKIILDNYFPLEIIEESNIIKGVETKYELVKMSLK
ncbi:hypothetical protein [uncultured Lacinutrix sp.]|uniref:hypothetical protein n=1 Tax=uncultured Lacinutrix sp. TaxID=574032 RepID=UPI0026040859|nr:hypothetical protein [uncultured Lacinutrix sp.]